MSPSDDASSESASGDSAIPSPSSTPAEGSASDGSQSRIEKAKSKGRSEPAQGGPVDELSAHVPDEWWKTLFGETYLLTDADVLGEQNTRADVDAVIDTLGLTPEMHVLDLCCGQGRHTLELARRGYEGVTGLDQSAHLIGEARAAARAQGCDVDFQEGDARDLPYDDGAFDAVLLMGNSFGYFAAQEDDRAALREVRRVLKAEGRVLLDLTDGAWLRARYEPRSWEWIDDAHLACRERTLDAGRLVTREVVVATGKGVIADQFYAERLYDRREMSTLLREAGFAKAAVTSAPKTASDRGQDLGMMGRRLFFSARMDGGLGEGAVRKEAAGAHRQNGRTVAPRDVLRVPVLLGDPRLLDDTKLGGAFDDDDFEVVRRLKDALATLEGYDFSYHDDHATLESELRALRGEADFAFNLCDEGLGNDARRELHVPALLEVLGVPCTGAGPQCLAACYDKSLVRGVAREIGVPVAEGHYLAPGAPAPEALPGLAFPVIVKPNTGDNSKGITQDSVARSIDDLPRAVAAVRAHVGSERALLIEAFLPGQDLTVGLLGNAGPGFSEEDLTVLPITAESYAHLPEGLPRLCGYEAKWLPDSPYWMGNASSDHADLPGATREALVNGSRRLFERLGCRDYARLDWRLDAEGQPRLLEVNPNPGWCWDGHLATQAALAGTDYAGVLGQILASAQRRVEDEAAPPAVPVP